MVLTAFRRPDSIVGASTAVVPRNGAPAHVQHDAPAPDHLMVAAPALFEDDSAYAPAFEHESESPILFDTPDAQRFDFFQDEDPDHRTTAVEADLSAFSENGTSRHREELAKEFVQSISATAQDSAEADESHPIGQRSEFTKSAVDSANTGSSVVEDRSEDPAGIGEEAATDPWKAPLPPWDYSPGEWPVLVLPSEQKSLRKLRFAIAAVVLLACAAGSYFLIYRLSTPQPRTATDSGMTARVLAVEPGAAAVGRADSDALAQAAPTPSDTPAAAASQPAETVAGEAEAPNDDSAKGRFSLQAAAFPTEGGADEIAEKLMQAGLPSYVVPADLARRGRWFRVRVGRFTSVEDAQRFAGEARQRARATGLTVQLIVCQYGQP